MPQPWSTFHPEKRIAEVELTFTPEDLVKREPLLCALVMQYIMQLSTIESSMMTIATAAFISADFKAVASMLEALTGTPARNAAIEAAAKATLSPDDFELFDAVQRHLKPLRNRRNEFAHHTWAWSGVPANAIMLINPARLHMDFAEYKHNRRFGTGTLVKEIGLDAEQYMVYREADLRRENEKANQAGEMVVMLTWALRHDSAIADSSRQELLALLPKKENKESLSSQSQSEPPQQSPPEDQTSEP